MISHRTPRSSPQTVGKTMSFRVKVSMDIFSRSLEKSLNLLSGHYDSPQNTKVIWDWDEPQRVGKTMSFRVKVSMVIFSCSLKKSLLNLLSGHYDSPQNTKVIWDRDEPQTVKKAMLFYFEVLLFYIHFWAQRF